MQPNRTSLASKAWHMVEAVCCALFVCGLGKQSRQRHFIPVSKVNPPALVFFTHAQAKEVSSAFDRLRLLGVKKLLQCLSTQQGFWVNHPKWNTNLV